MDKSFKINGLQYDSIGTLDINGQQYLVTKNGNDMVLIQVNKIDNNISYSIPQKDVNDPRKYKGIALAEQIIAGIKSDIDNGLIESKEDLQKRIQKVSNVINNNTTLQNLLNDNGLSQDKLKELYDYFDSIVKSDPELDMNGITSFKVDDQKYIKQFDSITGETHVLKDNNNNGFVDQFKQHQNEMAASNTDNPIANAENVFDIMKDYEKTEVNMNNIASINKVETKDDAKEVTAMKDSIVNDNNHTLIGDAGSNIYVDTVTGETLTAKTDGDKVTINRVNETEAGTLDNLVATNVTEATDEDYIAPDGTNPEDLPYDEIEQLIVKDTRMTEKQKEKMRELVERKKQQELEKQQMEMQQQLENPAKILKLEPPKPDSRAAYINLISLCLFVQVFMLLVIVGAIFFMK